MQADLREYYERELGYLRQTAQEFATRYPKIASRLVLGEKENPDPHVERLLEGVAFLAARIHLKLEDDFPEITDALLNVVYPHYLRPVPSMTVVEMQLDPQQAKLTSGLKVPRESMLFSRPVNGMPCRFRTAYDVTLWPISVEEANWLPADRVDVPGKPSGAAGALRVRLRCAPELTFDKLALKSLRFYLRSDDLNLVPALYEVLSNNCRGLVVRDPKNAKQRPVYLSAAEVKPVGFAEEEALLPYPKRSFEGYRLLHEYFVFPQKFNFIEVSGLEQVALAGFKEEVELYFFISSFQREERWQALERVDAGSLRLGCTPAVNLFQQTSEPILLKYTQPEYPIVPDVRRQKGMDIFSVDDVFSMLPGSGEILKYSPYFSFHHGEDTTTKRTFWYARRRESKWKDSAETYLTLVDLSGRHLTPDVEAVTCKLTCSNANLPSRLPFGGDGSDFELTGGGPIRAIRSLEKPTAAIEPKTGHEAFWRLISHLSLNHLSLVSEGREALQEILQLYNLSESISHNRQIQAIRTLNSKPHFARLISEHGISFARGYQVEMEIDEEGFAGAGVYLFGSVLDRFLGMYASLNSFSQLIVRTPQRKEVLRQWPPRAGRKVLM